MSTTKISHNISLISETITFTNQRNDNNQEYESHSLTLLKKFRKFQFQEEFLPILSSAMDLSIGRLTTRIPLKLRCSKDDRGKNDKGDRLSTDWDKAWSSFRKQGKKSLFSQFNPGKYVSWNPRRSEYPLSEEVDPIKRAERSNLMLWTSPKFTLIGAIIVVLVLLIYTLLAPQK